MGEARLPSRAEALARLTAPGQPYEIGDAHIDGRKLRVFRGGPRSLRELYAENATDATFIVYEGERLSFAQAQAQAARIAHLLVHRFGVRPGDRVAISMRNYPEWILAFMASTSIGAIAVAMNAWWQPDELEYGLRNCGARVLIADAERVDRFLPCASALPEVQVISVRTRTVVPNGAALEDLLAGLGEVVMPEVDVTPEHDAIIFYTSGSTGHPKGVVSTHRQVLSALLSWELDAAAAALMTSDPPAAPFHQAAALLGIPLFHATGSHSVYLMSYRLQRKLVCMYKWDPEQAAELIERERITAFMGPAAVTGDLVQVAKTTGRDLGSMLSVGGGGAPRAPEQVRQIDSSFQQAVPVTGWGMTETNAIGTGIAGADYLERPMSSGRCSAVMELRIVDDQGNSLPVGQRGELLVRGAGLFREYWNRPDLKGSTFEDGWFRTGDVATFDDDGFIYIVDRIKDLIIRGGENIGCGQVEAALLMHPEVLEAAVYAVPDERLGEEVGATVRTRSEVDADTLREFLQQHLARFEIPRYLRLIAEPLPRTASGKILKRQIRDEALAAMR